MFYKIHYQLVSIRIHLTSKFHLQPTRTENMFAYNIPSSRLVVIIICSHSFHELFGTGIRYLRKSFSWALSKLSDMPFLPSKDCWSAPCTCCVPTQQVQGAPVFAGSHGFLSAPVVWLHLGLVASTLLNGGVAILCTAYAHHQPCTRV